jgi:beta-glucosidase
MNGLSNGTATAVRRFPQGFLWGAGTSSYQIEGAVADDGRGRSIWDAFTHQPGRVFHGETGDIACDSYHRIDEDVALIEALGLDAYRFSVSWPRVQPDGRGAVNERGLDYYRALVGRLRQAGVMPVVTLYHWDLPQALEDRGGWAQRDTAMRLAELAELLGVALGDQVAMWITVNEPLQTVHQGYRMGTHAPGRCEPDAAAAANHHILLAHGLALEALRRTVPAGVPIGPTLDPHPYVSLEPAAAAVADTLDAQFNRAYLDPILRGAYPDGLAAMVPAESVIADGDMATIAAPIDFLGLNYYRPHHIRRGDWNDLRLGESRVAGFEDFVEYLAPDASRTVMGWPVVPDALREMLVRLHAESGGLPLYVTENGCASDDYIGPDGTVDDVERIEYLHDHLAAALDAIEQGVDLRGYFHWSLLDNFEWAHGYRRRFGLHYVDFATQRRVPKRSAGYYAQIAQTGELLSPGTAAAECAPERAVA